MPSLGAKVDKPKLKEFEVIWACIQYKGEYFLISSSRSRVYRTHRIERIRLDKVYTKIAFQSSI